MLGKCGDVEGWRSAAFVVNLHRVRTAYVVMGALQLRQTEQGIWRGLFSYAWHRHLLLYVQRLVCLF